MDCTRLPCCVLTRGLLTDHVCVCCVLLQTFWHSSAHVLGQVLELEYGVDLTIGPSLEEGFYYDCYMGDKVGGFLGGGGGGGGEVTGGAWV
jgi:hypothetical protein